jgi:O-succinylhomoserine sulfhydrylase
MAKKNAPEDWQIETQLVRGGLMRSNFGETSEALYLSAGFVYDSAETAESRFNGTNPGFVYSRYTNPNLAMLEQKLALIEGAERCCVMASGMAAVHASMMCFLKPGDKVVAHRVLFGSCHYIATQVMPRFGIQVELVDGTRPENWEKAIDANTKAVFIETPANPTLELVDIALVAGFCKKAGAKLVIDNVFATLLHQKPLELGADIVVYSTTKHIDGQGRTLGGAVLSDAKFVDEILLPYHRHTGPAMSPFTAWVLSKGLETLALRVERQCENAKALAVFLEKHPKIDKIFYPGLSSHPQHAIAQKQMKTGGSLIALVVKGGKEGAFRFMNKLGLVDISNNLGDTRSLITHPASSTHSNIPASEREAIGITDGLLRLSVGIEGQQDLLDDVAQALS